MLKDTLQSDEKVTAAVTVTYKKLQDISMGSLIRTLKSSYGQKRNGAMCTYTGNNFICNFLLTKYWVCCHPLLPSC